MLEQGSSWATIGARLTMVGRECRAAAGWEKEESGLHKGNRRWAKPARPKPVRKKEKHHRPIQRIVIPFKIQKPFINFKLI
jgi:hypothetical protein